MSKGVSFMTEEVPNELVHVMMEEGVKKAYGENVD